MRYKPVLLSDRLLSKQYPHDVSINPSLGKVPQMEDGDEKKEKDEEGE